MMIEDEEPSTHDKPIQVRFKAPTGLTSRGAHSHLRKKIKKRNWYRNRMKIWIRASESKDKF